MSCPDGHRNPAHQQRHAQHVFVRHQVVIRVRPMFDVEVEAGQTYAVQIAADDPHRLEARDTPKVLSVQTSWTAQRTPSASVNACSTRLHDQLD